MTVALPSDSTLTTIVEAGRLLDGEGLVADVLQTMHDCRRSKGNAFVRIGITGEGKAPYHKVVYLDEAEKEHLFGSYYRLKKDEKYNVHQDTWSTTASSFEEVQQLLGAMRKSKLTKRVP